MALTTPVCLLVLLLAGVGTARADHTAASICKEHSECPTAHVCIGNLCQAKTCRNTIDCPSRSFCNAGKCESSVVPGGESAIAAAYERARSSRSRLYWLFAGGMVIFAGCYGLGIGVSYTASDPQSRERNTQIAVLPVIGTLITFDYSKPVSTFQVLAPIGQALGIVMAVVGLVTKQRSEMVVRREPGQRAGTRLARTLVTPWVTGTGAGVSLTVDGGW